MMLQAIYKPWLKAVQLCAVVILFTVTSPVQALDKINTTFFGNLAVQGYDTVAYFTQNKAVEGSERFQYQWQGVNWRFSSAQHLGLFKADPAAYAPQYGGYCAYAVSHNDTASIEPEQFTVLKGKLYLNYSRNINNEWSEDREGYIKLADKNWPLLLKK
jgi:YHS domain-containing protein